MIRRAARRDGNHAEIVNGLRKAGHDVLDLGAVGDGCPDLLARNRSTDRLLLMEVKDPTKPIRDQRLTEPQVKFHAQWAGSVVVVKSLEDALAAIAHPTDDR